MISKHEKSLNWQSMQKFVSLSPGAHSYHGYEIRVLNLNLICQEVANFSKTHNHRVKNREIMHQVPVMLEMMLKYRSQSE